jgi:creatinine amidohydrolase/Fe(II)-dependent formamide hydrolase-like protein
MRGRVQEEEPVLALGVLEQHGPSTTWRTAGVISAVVAEMREACNRAGRIQGPGAALRPGPGFHQLPMTNRRPSFSV